MAHEKILRQQKEREVQSNLDLLDRQGQEMDLLKALLGKLQKYERDSDQKHIPVVEQNKRNKEVCTVSEYKYMLLLFAFSRTCIYGQFHFFISTYIGDLVSLFRYLRK